MIFLRMTSPESISFETNSSLPNAVMNGTVTKVSNGKFSPK